jgi:hypothetical protein
MTIKTVVAEFVDRLSALIESESAERTRAAVLSAFGLPPRRGPGRPPKVASLAQGKAPAAKSEAKSETKARKKPRKKAPLQLCPVPGCKNPAAPIFGMVCAKHKGLPKATIKKYREARRAKKLGLPVPKARRRRTVKKVKKASAPKAAKRAAAMPAPASSAATSTEAPATASN